MMEYMIPGVVLFLLNLSSFVMMGIDKRRAINDKHRVSERMLLLYAAPFAALGAYAGMKIFRHKIRNPKFYIGVPVMLLMQVAIMVWFFVGGYS